MFGAPAVVDVIAAAQGVEAVGGSGVLLPGNVKRVDHPLRRYRRHSQESKFGIDESHVEAGVVDNQHVVAEEFHEVLRNRSKDRLVP